MCLERCPDEMTYGVRFGDISPEECACISGTPAYHQMEMPSECFPSPDHLWYERRHAPIRSVRTLDTLFPNSRMPYFQLQQGDVVETVNGEPVKGPASLDRIFHLMPELAPDVITVRRGNRYGQPAGSASTSVVEIHYVSQEVLREIEHSLNDNVLAIAPQLPHLLQQTTGFKTLIVGSRYRSWEPGKADPDSQRLDAAAAWIANIAKKTRHIVPESDAPFDCSKVRGMLKRVALLEGKRAIELSYIDWIDAGTRTAQKMGALRRAPGSPSDEGIAKDTALAKVVNLPQGFAIDRTEVTRQQYETWLMTDPPTKGQAAWCAWNGDYTPRCEWPPAKKGNHPVVCIDWCDAFAYCKAVGKRLCGAIGGGAVARADVDNAQKSQWYAACSAGGGLPFPYGDSYESEICNGQDKTVTGCHHGSCTTADVGALGDCQSPGSYAGVYDLSGNVSEFEDSCDGNIGADDACRIRGGSFRASGGKLRCKAQDSFRRSESHDHIGFRCCSDF